LAIHLFLLLTCEILECDQEEVSWHHKACGADNDRTEKLKDDPNIIDGSRTYQVSSVNTQDDKDIDMSFHLLIWQFI